MVQLFSLLQVSPGSPVSLVMSYLAAIVSAGEHCYFVYSPQLLQASRSIMVPLYPPCLAGEGTIDLTLFQDSCSQPIRCWAWGCSSPGPRVGPRDFTAPKQSPYHLFCNVFYNFGLQPSYMLGYHWLFTLFLRRSARCSTCAQE